MKVLHVNAGNLYGGIETVLALQARERSVCPELEPWFAIFFEGRLSSELRAASASVTLLGAARVRYPWTIHTARRRLGALLLAEKPDVAVTHSPWTHLIAAPVARRSGVALAHWLHSPAVGKLWLDRWAERTPPDVAIANSHYTARATTIWAGVPIAVVHNPVARRLPKVSRASVRESIATPVNAVVIVITARLERWKGHLFLVEALARLRADERWVAWIAGGPQRPAEAAYLDQVKRAVVAAGIESRVRFLGERSDVPDVLAAADIHCQPNVEPEPFGVAFVEALHAGLPVVTTAIGAAPEIVDASCGVLVPGDAAALAAALGRLVDDPVERARLGEAGKLRARLVSDPAARIADLLVAFKSAVKR